MGFGWHLPGTEAGGHLGGGDTEGGWDTEGREWATTFLATLEAAGSTPDARAEAADPSPGAPPPGRLS